MHGRVLGRLLLAGAMVLFLEACATASGGRIPPSAFEFHEIVSNEEAGAGGWKVAQVNILLARISQYRPLHAWCDVEVGVPLANKKRSISNTVAQKRSAEAADEAAQLVLLGNETISAIACKQFRDEMLVLLRGPIKGVKVTKFMTQGIEPRSFPED